MRKNNTTSDADRKRICESHDQGISIKDISHFSSIKKTTVHEIVKNYIRTGSMFAKRRGGLTTSKLTDQQKICIKSWVEEDVTISLNSICQRVNNEFNILIAKSTVARILDAFHFSLKRIHKIPEKRNDTHTILLRLEYARHFISLPALYSEDHYIFIDEVGFNVSMRVTRGRSLVGTPATQNVPSIRSRNISVCCAINKNGIILYETQPTPYKTTSFFTYITNLITNLRNRQIDNAIFIMDNVRFHKSETIISLINQNNYGLLYLAPYSPFLNPIENMFSKWKNIVKRANPVNENDLMNAIHGGANLIREDDCNGYFRHMASYIPRCISSEVIND